MTPQYYAWLTFIAERDQMLVNLALIGIGCVVAWELLRFLPPALAERLRQFYLVGWLIAFVISIAAFYVVLFGANKP